LLFAFSAQETWNSCNSTVNVIPAPSYDSTFVLEAPSREALKKGMANWVPASSGGSSYLVYTALLTQTETNAPVATVLENTLGGTPSFGYSAAGQYTITLSEAFTANKTIAYAPNYYISGDAPNIRTTIERASSSMYYIYSFDGGAPGDGVLSGAFVEIRVYPN
jgi:hypothetical protein